MAFLVDQNLGDCYFGSSVAIASEFAIVGASYDNKAFIFKNTGGTWETTAAFTLDHKEQNTVFACKSTGKSGKTTFSTTSHTNQKSMSTGNLQHSTNFNDVCYCFLKQY